MYTVHCVVIFNKAPNLKAEFCIKDMMAISLISFLLLLWVTYSCAADISVRIVFNNSIIQEQSSDESKSAPLKDINGTLDGIWRNISPRWHDPALMTNLPNTFDPRDKWPFCHSLNDIHDQGACGSCWVFGSVPAITDRYCIASNGTKQFQASAEDALTCSNGGGCQQGGYPFMVYMYWKNEGIVSGGQYDSKAGCEPYTIPPCNIHYLGMPCFTKDYVSTPRCKPYCVGEYPNSYEDDRQFASEIYKIEGEDNIKAELYLNGPVSAIMDVYEDFITHKGGIYRHRLGEYWYGHVVKIMGWGVEDGVKYWLAANSWNVEWGEKGFFKIARGENHCGIEDYVITGQPKLKK